MNTRATDTKFLRINVLSILSFITICKHRGKKWNAKEKNTEQTNASEWKLTLYVRITLNINRYC